jgi:hypothetical protein
VDVALVQQDADQKEIFHFFTKEFKIGKFSFDMHHRTSFIHGLSLSKLQVKFMLVLTRGIKVQPPRALRDEGGIYCEAFLAHENQVVEPSIVKGKCGN